MSPAFGKVFWLVFNPANALTACLVLGAVLLFTRWRRAGRFFVVIAALGALAMGYVPIGAWLLAPLESRFALPAKLPERIDGIIVLGGAIDTRQSGVFGQIAVNGRAERLLAFVELGRRHPGAKLVYSGGAGLIRDEPKSEAEIAAPLLAALGLPAERLLLETKSRDTDENARFSRELAKPRPGETWVLVTSAAHMPRAYGVFTRLGWRVVPYPVDYRCGGEGDEAFGQNLGRGLNLLNVSLREWLSLAHYYLSGRIESLLPGPG
jgi:uncharacterized SAM-binding protein YcdF (DUF218 family)